MFRGVDPFRLCVRGGSGARLVRVVGGSSRAICVIRGSGRVVTRRSWLAAAFSAVLCVALIVVCGAQSTTEFTWDLPNGFPMPAVPTDNPMSVAKVELGRHLFYDLRLSGNGQQSCATCHQQDKAFTDGLTTSAGSTGEDHPRNSMSLVNVAYAATLTWANPTMTRLEDQALVPMFGRHPIELGLGEDREWLDPLRREPRYGALFERAFPGEADGFTRVNVVKALATFQRTIVSARSPYDRYHFERDDQAVPAAAKRGEVTVSQPASGLFHVSRGLQSLWRDEPVGISGKRRRRVPQHRALQSSWPAVVSGAQHRHPRDHARSQGRRKVQGADAAEHCCYSALHARRQH